MDDHFWPSLYPGMIIGILLGLSRGGVISTMAGAAGGTCGAAVMYFVVARLGLEEGIASLFALIAGATVGAYLCERGSARLTSHAR